MEGGDKGHAERGVIADVATGTGPCERANANRDAVKVERVVHAAKSSADGEADGDGNDESPTIVDQVAVASLVWPIQTVETSGTMAQVGMGVGDAALMDDEGL